MPPRAPPAVCVWPDCGREYATKRDLQRHQLSHGAPQFACNTPGCDRKFYRRDALLRHQRNKTCARRLARRDKGDDDEDTEDATGGSPVDTLVEGSSTASNSTVVAPVARRPEKADRTDSLESSASLSQSYPIPYRQAIAPIRTTIDPVDEMPSGMGFEEDDFEEDDDDEYLDDRKKFSNGGPASPIRTSSYPSRRYGPYDASSSYGIPTSPRSPTRSPTTSMRTPYSYLSSSYGAPPLASTFFDSAVPNYTSGSFGDRGIYGNTSNARGSTAAEDHDEEY